MPRADSHVDASLIPVCLHVTGFSIIANWFPIRPDFPTIFSRDSLRTAFKKQTDEEVWAKQRKSIRQAIISLLNQDSTLAEAVTSIKRFLLRLKSFCEAPPDGQIDFKAQYEPQLLTDINEAFNITHPEKVSRDACQAALDNVPDQIEAGDLSLSALFTSYPRKGKPILQLAVQILKDQEAEVELQRSLDSEMLAIAGSEVTLDNALEQLNQCCAHMSKVQAMAPDALQRIQKLGYSAAGIDARVATICVLVLRSFAEQWLAFVDGEKQTLVFGEIQVQSLLEMTKPSDISGLRGALEMVDRLQQKQAVLSEQMEATAATDLRSLLKDLQDINFEILRDKRIHLSSGNSMSLTSALVVESAVFDVIAKGMTTLTAKISEQLSRLSTGPLLTFCGEGHLCDELRLGHRCWRGKC